MRGSVSFVTRPTLVYVFTGTVTRPTLVYRYCPRKSQQRTGNTREPDPTHNELKHTTTRKTASHERTPDKPHVHTHTHTSRTENDAQDQQTSTPPRRHSRAHTHQDTHSTDTPTRERARQWNHRLRELHRPLRQRLRPLPPLPLHLPLPPNLVELEAGTVPGVFLTSTIPHKVRVALRRRL